MDYAILLLSCIIELYIFFDFFRSFFPMRERFRRPYRVLIVTIPVCIIYFLVNTLNISYLNLAFFPVMLFVYASVLFISSIWDRILYIIFVCSIFWGCEFLFMILLELPSFIMQQHGILNISSMPWHIFTLKLFTYVICNIFKQLSVKSHRHMDGKVFICYLCIPFASIGIMFLTYYSGVDFSTNLYTKIMLCIYFAIMQIGNILIFYAFEKYSEELYHTMQQDFIIYDQNRKLDYYTQVQELNDKHREFIHDTNRYIKTIGHLLNENKIQDAMNIIHDLNIELETNTTALYSNHAVLNSILSRKKAAASIQHIDMDIYVEPNIRFGEASDIDLITILDNLLDNAIEASAKCQKTRAIRIRIFLQNQESFSVIKISNSYVGELKRERNHFLSTKNTAGIHGVGLKSVEHTAEKCGGYLSCYTERNIFTAIVLLPIRPDSDRNLHDIS